jgi:hypothetical protein
VLPWQAHGGEFANFIVIPRTSLKFAIVITCFNFDNIWKHFAVTFWMSFHFWVVTFPTGWYGSRLQLHAAFIVCVIVSYCYCQKAKQSHYRPKQAQRVGRGIALFIRDLGARREWVDSLTSQPLYPRERPGTHCTGGWGGLRAGLDECEKSRHHRDSIPGPSCP